MLLSLYINNKAGGLIYHRVSSPELLFYNFCAHIASARSTHIVPRGQDFAAHAAKLDVNDHLRLASTFNGLALIMKQLSPARGSSFPPPLACSVSTTEIGDGENSAEMLARANASPATRPRAFARRSSAPTCR